MLQIIVITISLFVRYNDHYQDRCDPYNDQIAISLFFRYNDHHNDKDNYEPVMVWLYDRSSISLSDLEKETIA